MYYPPNNNQKQPPSITNPNQQGFYSGPPQYGPPPRTPGQFYHPPQQPPPRKPYSNLILFILATLCFLSFILIGVTSNQTTPETRGNVGASLFLGILVSVLVIDWHGFTTLHGWINWKQAKGKKRFWLWCLYLFLFEGVLVIYFIRTAILFFAPTQQAIGQNYPPQRSHKVSIGLTAGAAIALIGMVTTLVAPPTTETTSTPQSTPSTVITQAAATAQPALKPTAPPVSPTLTSKPIPTSRPQPTQPPVAQPAQAPTPIPTSPPAQLSITVTSASAIDNAYGSVRVHTLPGAVLTIRVVYCTGFSATSASLRGTSYADSGGNYTWTWRPDTKCKGPATATVIASLNGQSVSGSAGFNVQ